MLQYFMSLIRLHNKEDDESIILPVADISILYTLIYVYNVICIF